MSDPIHDRTLRLIVEGTAGATGDAFFRALVRHLAAALNVKYAWVAEFTATHSRVRTLAFWSGETHIDNFEYDLAGAPCGQIYESGSLCHYRKGLQRLFPDDRSLAKLQAESYIGVPLRDTSGLVLGHLAVIDTREFAAEERDMFVFRIFAERATAELVRLRADEAVRESRERLAGILDSAMDAIITVDERRHVTLLNRSAETIFGVRAADLLHHSVDPLLSGQFRRLLIGYMDERRHENLWLSEGLTAIRSSGEEFPVEATLSSSHVLGKDLVTIILRDIQIREKTEQHLRLLENENIYLKEEILSEHGPDEIVGSSTAIQAVLNDLSKVAKTDSTVLLTGETGTGKELFARRIHDRSLRSQHMMISVNCAAIPANLAESELFGHEKGAFTGAGARKKGRFELADGGTIFLDEVGELTSDVQAKILRVMNGLEFERVGGTEPIHVNVRVIAATNRNLEEMVRQGSFRSDLFYRLNIFPIHLPPLRERAGDVPLLVEHLVSRLSRRMGRLVKQVTPDAMGVLNRYSWPGNVRELANVIERAIILSEGEAIDSEHVVIGRPAESPSSLMSTLHDMERQMILRALESAHFVVGGPQGAAHLLGISRTTLISKMKKLKIDIPRS